MAETLTQISALDDMIVPGRFGRSLPEGPGVWRCQPGASVRGGDADRCKGQDPGAGHGGEARTSASTCPTWAASATARGMSAARHRA